MGKKALWAACVAVLMAGATACGDSDDGAAGKPSSVPAAKLCDGTLGTSAAAALGRLGDTERFQELDGTDGDGRPNAFSLASVADDLRKKPVSSNTCAVYSADLDTDTPMIDITFETVTTPPDPAKPARDGDLDRILFPVGAYASVGKGKGASLYFACPRDLYGKDAGFVKAGMYIDEGMIDPGGTAGDRMAVLNAVSRGLAAELGCAAEADLPAEVPEGHVLPR
ncbi:hypothetical protein OG786_19295 [Streptomyces sp. NBC_00101]|uniref:hypothetical protein n=1 Tax=Streptomyces sp. NBC_00101 TaxID=2975651 RepID=UPI0032466B37